VKELATKTRGTFSDPPKLNAALDHALGSPTIFITVGIHGNILFPDVSYCEFDNVQKAWDHFRTWAEFTKHAHGSPKDWENCFPVGFEVGVVSLVELAKKYPVWDILRDSKAEIINPLYGQPYLRLIGEESNFRQFQTGLNILREQGIELFAYTSSEHALHPQLPQLLKGFGLSLAYVVARLAGGAPTSYHPKVLWQGADGTEILAIASQSGIPNGHIWHGKFYEELPSLIFASVARPDLTHVCYSNIEDMAYDIKGVPEIASHLREFERANIKFRHFKDLAGENIPIARTVQWGIADFPIRDLRYAKMIPASYRAERCLVNFESCTALAYLPGEIQASNIHERIAWGWKQLLAAQNHDAFIVPFTTPGMYSQMQGLAENYEKDENLAIGNYCARMCADVVNHLEKSELFTSPGENPQGKWVNWLWDRSEWVDNQYITLPAVSISTNLAKNSPPERYSATGKQWIQQILGVPNEYITGATTNGLTVHAPGWSGILIDKSSRWELNLTADKDVELEIRTKNPFWITYPFGAEPSTEMAGHTLHFLWVEQEFVIVHDHTPYYRRTETGFCIQIPAGSAHFAIAEAKTLREAYRRAWEAFYPLLMISKEQSVNLPEFTKRIEYNDFIPTSIQSDKAGWLIRGFFVGEEKPKIEKGTLDYFVPLAENSPHLRWKIATLKIFKDD
jgi:hypothetical protein